MAKWVCQIPKSRLFVDLKMARLNIWVGRGNRINIFYYICLCEEDIMLFFFFSFLNFCKLQHLSFNSSDKLKWEQSDSTPRTEAVYTRLPFQFCRTKRGFCHSFGYLNLSLCLSAQPLTFWGSWITSHVWPQYYIFFSPQIIFSQNLQLLKEHTSLGNAPFLS